jgi:DNA-binding NtrC family response regulator
MYSVKRMLTKVLIIDDAPFVHSDIEHTIAGPYFDIFHAHNTSEAWEHMTKHTDFDVIVIDACVHDITLNTLDLVDEAQRVGCPVRIANSGAPELRQKMLDRGCTHECEKAGLTKLLLKLFPVDSVRSRVPA